MHQPSQRSPRLAIQTGCALLVGLLCASGAFAPADAVLQAADPAIDVNFFESKIRPVLVKHCYECHSTEADELEGNLAVDSRDGLRTGGDNGPAVVPKNLEESFLLRAIKYEEDDYQMPPEGKLPDKVIADFEKWILGGAPDPREATAARAPRREIDLEEGRRYWAFRGPQRAAPPPVQDTAWPLHGLDHFVLAGLQQQGLQPAPPADRATWLRRVTFDLTGLPPTVAELDAFLEDSAPAAHDRVVDRLLASPRMGERWGRHWLDLARYADSNGLDINVTFHQAWRYRDYVVNTFNQDRPYRQFVLEQIAGDLLPYEDDRQRTRQLIATGYLVVGAKMLSERDKEKLRMDVVDEQIDTTGRVFLGLTLGCARCHDHKFDPVPTRDYYALAGIFRNTVTVDGIKLGNAFVSGWKVRPLPIEASHAEALQAHADALATLEKKLKSARDRQSLLAKKFSVGKLEGIVVDDQDAQTRGNWKHSTYSKNFVGKGYIHDENTEKGRRSVAFSTRLPASGRYEVRLAFPGSKGRASAVPVTIQHAKGMETIQIDQTRPAPINKMFLSLGSFDFSTEQNAVVTISNAGTEGYVIADAVQWIAESSDKKPGTDPAEDPEATQARQEFAGLKSQIQELEAQQAELKKQAPPPAPMAMAVADVEQPDDAHLRLRGNVHRLGPKIPRGVLQVALTDDAVSTFSASGSGRQELAEWIADEDNPLTSRVLVNRVWQHLMGEGLVRSVDNFGHLGQRPTHPELLDYLAVEFDRSGQSVKQLIRSIVLSQTYRMSSQFDEKAYATDPENHLLWRQPARRLEAEAIRDAMLAIGGNLDLAMGGTAVATLGERALDNGSKSPIDTEASRLRSVYLPIIRSDVPALLQVFDFADPEMVAGRRATTTVPAQALFLMNSPFVRRQAKSAAVSLLTIPSPELRVQQFYRQAYSHSPSDEEVESALQFVASYGAGDDADEQAAWTAFCHAVLGSSRFRFID